MEAVDKLKKAPAHDRSGMGPDPDKLLSMKVLANA